jgi:hypothetical protein
MEKIDGAEIVVQAGRRHLTDRLQYLADTAKEMSIFIRENHLSKARNAMTALLEGGISQEEAVDRIQNILWMAEEKLSYLEELKDEATVQLQVSSSQVQGEDAIDALHEGSGYLLDVIEALRMGFDDVKAITQFLHKASGPEEER